MDSFDFSDDAMRPRADRSTLVWNILTVVVLLMVVCIGSIFLLVLINPWVSFNPFPPEKPPVLAQVPTPTPTPKPVLMPTWTPTASPAVILIATPTPIALIPTPITPEILPTEFPVLTYTPEAQNTAAPGEGMPFVLHSGDPVAISNVGHTELGCEWTGVGGRVFDLSGAPITQGVFIQLGGTFDGKPVEMLGMVGMVNYYGAGSYEFVLGDEPMDSEQLLWVQLIDQANLPLSDQIYFDTYANCDKNLILINFNQVR
jgi:hypothetical protein